jgi:hypothetical protein
MRWPFVYFISAGQNGPALFAGVVNNPNDGKYYFGGYNCIKVVYIHSM